MLKDGMGSLLKQAQKMQEDMQKAQEKLAETESIGNAGGGLVKVVMNGRHDVKRVDIDDSLMQEEKSMLEDLLAAAVNDAVRKIEKAQQDNMSHLTSGLNIPPGFKMPF